MNKDYKSVLFKGVVGKKFIYLLILCIIYSVEVVIIYDLASSNLCLTNIECATPTDITFS